MNYVVQDDVIKADAKPSVGTTPAIVEENVNLELLNKTLDYIKAHPQTWYQGEWYSFQNYDNLEMVPHLVEIKYEEINSCGTAMCFAGHAALIEGFPAPPKYAGTTWARKVDGEYYRESVSDFATKRLGLRADVANELFDATNTMEVLEAMVAELNENPRASCWTLDGIRDNILDLEDEYDEDYTGDEEEDF